MIASGAATCAVTPDQTIVCSGMNDFGQLGGDPTPCDAPGCIHRPARVPSTDGATHVVTTTWGACAVHADGGLTCWGSSDSAGTGLAKDCGPDYARTSCSTPARVSIGAPVADVAVGGISCALTRAADVSCWGSRGASVGLATAGMCSGTPCARSPQRVPGLGGAQQVVVGYDFLCARFADGEVQCMGDNSNGQLGDGTTTARPEARMVLGLPPIAELRAHGESVCGRTADDAVWCWGNNEYGVVLGASANAVSVPVRVLGPRFTP